MARLEEELSDDNENLPGCVDCDRLEDLLLQAEQRCREAEYGRTHEIMNALGTDQRESVIREEFHRAKMDQLESARDWAFEALSMHLRTAHCC